MLNPANLSNTHTFVDSFRVAIFKNGSSLQQKVMFIALAILTLAVLFIAAKFIKKGRCQLNVHGSVNDHLPTPTAGTTSTVPSTVPSTPSKANPATTPNAHSLPPAMTSPTTQTSPNTIPSMLSSVSSSTPSASPSISAKPETIWIGTPPSDGTQQVAKRPNLVHFSVNLLYVQYPDVGLEQDIYAKESDYGSAFMLKIAHCSIRHFLTEAPTNPHTKNFMFDVDVPVPNEPVQPIRLSLKKNPGLTLGLLSSRNGSLSPVYGTNVQLFDDEQVQRSFEELDVILKARQPKPT